MEKVAGLPPKPETATGVQRLIEMASRQRLPELFGEKRPEALLQVLDRSGITTVAMRTTDLTDEQLAKLASYKVGQLVHPGVNVLNPSALMQAEEEFEPLADLLPDDIHFIAGAAETGEILCYTRLRGLGAAPEGTTLRVWERPLFPVERVHGWGIYNRLRILPDLPLRKVRELERYTKNHRLPVLSELGIRAPIELSALLYRTLIGPLALEMEAVIGDLEEKLAIEDLTFFHAPSVLVYGTVPYVTENSYYFPRYQYNSVYPFAIYGADISTASLARLAQIEEALALPGKRGLLGLIELRRDLTIPRSTLEPGEGPLAPATQPPQRGIPMDERREVLDTAHRLRQLDLFAGLTDAETRALGSCMERSEREGGDTVIHQGEASDDLFLIEAGSAEVRVRSITGQPLAVAILGPGDFFGEIALVTGGRRMADVVALTPVTLLRLTKEAYASYLGQIADVEQQITRAAAHRASETVRKVVSGEP